MTTETYAIDCIICGKLIEDYNPRPCCSGYECGCMGKATEPPVCSQACFDALMNENRNKKTNG